MVAMSSGSEEGILVEAICKGTYGSLKEKAAGLAAPASSRGLQAVYAVSACILVVELCERLAFYTFTGTQEFFLEHLGYSLSEAGGVNAAMGTLCMAWAVLAGWLADAVLGRYHTIMALAGLYAVGALVAAAAAYPAHEDRRLYLFGVMALIPVGTAGIKANISNFGADQYDTSDPEQAAAQEKFFSWFYLSINLGSAVAYGYLTTMGSNGGLGVPKAYGYFAVYVIAAVAMVLAVCVFASKGHLYRRQPVLKRSAIAEVMGYVSRAARQGSSAAGLLCAAFVLLLVAIVASVVVALAPGTHVADVLTNVAFLAAGVGILLVVSTCRDASWLGDQHTSTGSVSAADVRDYLRLLPVLFMGNLAFSALYNSMQFWYQQQACQMDLRVSEGGDFQFSGSFFCIADCLGIVVATPLALGWVNPAMERWGRRMGVPFGHAAKYGLGMSLGGLSVLAAGHLECLRRLSPVTAVASNCAPDGVKMSALPASWMLLPFFLMGLGEIYTQPVLMHLAYTQSPPSMRTLAAVTGMLIGAVSTALFTVQIAALAPFVPNDLNRGRLEVGYFTNIVLGGVFYAAFVVVMSTFQERRYAE